MSRSIGQAHFAAVLAASVASSLAPLSAAPAQDERVIEASSHPYLVDLQREPDAVIPIWPDGLPVGAPDGLVEHIEHRENPFGLVDRAAHAVIEPALSVFRPESPDGSAILIIPGGGYRWVVVDKEGFEGARLFNRRGATVYVLKHRLPGDGWSDGGLAPLADAQRAIRTLRARAAADGVDPSRVAVVGFSAGGHVTGSLALSFDVEAYASRDAVDALSARPDAAALIYPVVTMQSPFAHPGSRDRFLGASPTPEAVSAASLETRARADAPPMFILHAADDTAVPVENALLLFGALRAAGAPATLHIYDRGGHGFGVRPVEGPVSAWPDVLNTWLAHVGVGAPTNDPSH